MGRSLDGKAAEIQCIPVIPQQARFHNRAQDACAQANHRLGTTHWSVVDAIVVGDTEAAREAWERVARWYWYPLYAFALVTTP